MALREIRTFDDQILRKQCRAVDVIDDHVLSILQDMAETMYHSNGGGLSGNQVGILRRLVVIDVGEGLLQLINPEIVSAKGEQLVAEGCLSFPDVWGKVKRPQAVTVKYLNEKGEQCTVNGEGLLAQCLSHEIDHLNGIVFLSKITEFIKP